MTARDANDIARERGADGVRLAWDEAHTVQDVAAEPQRFTNEPMQRSSRPHWRTQCLTAAALKERTFPPVSYVVPGFIPEGLTLLAGKPKIGKSWLALDVCLAIAANRFCLGDRRPEQGDVLYCALEDNPRRLQRRIDKLVGAFTTEWPERLTLATNWRRLDEGGVQDIAEWNEVADAPRLVVLDTLAGVKPIRTTSGYIEDYGSLVGLHRLANDKAVAVLVLHHTRKMEADDPIDTVSGTLGLAGCSDTIVVLARSSSGSTLYIRGRDIEEAEHAVAFDRASCKWTILGEAADVRRSAERGRILVTLENGELALQDLVAATGMKSDNVRKLLHHMVKAGEVIRRTRGTYARSPSIE
jgi:RecA-family ATPase